MTPSPPPDPTPHHNHPKKVKPPGLDSGTPPQTPKKKGVRGLHAFPTRLTNPRMPHAVRTPTNGVRTAGLACGPSGQACWPCTPVRRACRPCTPSGQACTAGTPVRPGSRKPLNLRGLREPGRTGVPAMHACPKGVQALHALRTGVHGRHACPARLT
ncbi:hypothetical protein PCANC_27568 [Puccinia coronata f. sp. avenae]|uniref:Uncharacterized protein n=1 Tax=Puccinia coronata f. sp. avenae TaxID=200324 RepID=A0A2N5TJ39_9BASI|nr:hypothetical protein PCANC_27568 [Puccinia coronata f. sp. avenae]